MFKLLSQFKTVGETLNITKASERLGISQPTLTQNLARLEKSLQVKLIKRRSNGVELTKEGKDLHQDISKVMEMYTSCLNKVQKKNQEKRQSFYIGSGINWTHTDFFSRLKEVMVQHDRVTFHMVSCAGPTLEQKLFANEYDMALGSIPHELVQQEDIMYVPVFDTRMVVFADKSHPIFECDEINNEELRRHQWVILRHIDENETLNSFYDSFMGLNQVQFNSASVTTCLKFTQGTQYLILLPIHFKELAASYGLEPLSHAASLPRFRTGMMYLKQNHLAHEIAQQMLKSFERSKMIG